MPQKTLKINEDDIPWVTSEVKTADRLRKREYRKHKKSQKWKKLDQRFNEKSEKAIVKILYQT